MASNPPFIFHQAKHARPDERAKQQSSSHPDSARLPVIPDLRFEHSYLRSIQPFIQIRHPPRSHHHHHHHHRTTDTEDLEGYEKIESSAGGKGKEKERESQEPSAIPAVVAEVVEIQWDKVLWITTRDQMISPLLQGALWAIASYFLTPLFAQAGANVGTFIRSRFPSKEGLGITWLRDQVKNLKLVDSRGSH